MSRRTPSRAQVLERLYAPPPPSIGDEQVWLIREGVVRTWAREVLGIRIPAGQVPTLVSNAFTAAQSLAWDGIRIDDTMATDLLMSVEP